jgi:hypothetical protein
VTAVELMRIRSVLCLGWHSGELLLNRSGTRENRWLILLAVFVAHSALVLLATRATRQMLSAPFSAADSLLLLLLPQAVPDRPNSVEVRRGVELKRSRAPRHEPAPERAFPNDVISLPDTPHPPPPVDWAGEADAAVRNSLVEQDKERSYRNLSSLSAAQLDWVRRNQMVPMSPSFQWDHRRRDNGNRWASFGSGSTVRWCG